MAIYRTVRQTFWTDAKVVDDFTPEDRYFYLYLMTNPHTNLCGCYELSFKSASDETGYTRDTIERLLNRLEKDHDVIYYSRKTKEVLIRNWSKYNWTRSADFQKPLRYEIENVKDADFKAFLLDELDGVGTVSRRSDDGVGTSVSVSVTVSDKYSDSIKQIIDYLNTKANTRYKYSSDKTKKHIHARLEEGFTVEDFKTVIDKKCAEWLDDPKMNQYLRPETLFGTKFEGYLNQGATVKRKVNIMDL